MLRGESNGLLPSTNALRPSSSRRPFRARRVHTAHNLSEGRASGKPPARARSSIGQADIVLRQRALRRLILLQKGQFGLLHTQIERALLGKTVQKIGHPPAEPLVLPDPRQRLARVILEPAIVALPVMPDQRLAQVMHVARGGVEPL